MIKTEEARMNKLVKILCHVILVYGLFLATPLTGKPITVSGVATASNGAPIAGACFCFTTQPRHSPMSSKGQLKIDTVYTANDGSFTKSILVDDYALGLRYYVLVHGYTTHNGYGSILKDRVTLKRVVLKRKPQKKATISGTVTDALAQPVHQAQCFFTSGITIDTTPVFPKWHDTLYTNQQGNIPQDIFVNRDYSHCLFLIVKQGFHPLQGVVPIKPIPGNTNSEIDLGLISLKAPVYKSITVLGSIYDAATQRPIADALVSLVSKQVITVDSTTLSTPSSGAFSASLNIYATDHIRPLVRYTISKAGYLIKEGFANINTPELNLGAIALQSQSAITRPILPLHLTSNTHVTCYTLSGQRLYSGTLAEAQQWLLQSTTIRPIVFSVGKNGTTISNRIITIVK